MSEYDDFVASSPQGSPFATSWWLDAVAGPGRWRSNELREGDEIVAAWPTVVRRSRAGDVHVGAPLTPYLGPLFAPVDDESRRRSNELQRLEQLLEAMRPFAHLEARCHPSFDYWTPLHWQGFTQTTHYTWQLRDLAAIDEVFANLRDTARRQVKKARKLGLAVETASVEEFLPLHQQTFDRQQLGERAPTPDLIRRIDEAAGARDARTILIARDADGRPHSGAFYVRDHRCTWYLLGGSDTSLRSSGAASLVMWTAIEQAAARGHYFDFEGSMLQHVERFVRGFGGQPTPYSIVHATPSRAFRTQRSVKRTVRSITRR